MTLSKLKQYCLDNPSNDSLKKLDQINKDNQKYKEQATKQIKTQEYLLYKQKQADKMIEEFEKK